MLTKIKNKLSAKLTKKNNIELQERHHEWERERVYRLLKGIMSEKEAARLLKLHVVT